MEKETVINNYNHGINLVERKSLLVSGVKKIDSFDNEQFLMDTVMGSLRVLGEELELIKLDTMQGNVSIKGIINSITYLDNKKEKTKENSFLNRLFK